MQFTLRFLVVQSFLVAHECTVQRQTDKKAAFIFPLFPFVSPAWPEFKYRLSDPHEIQLEVVSVRCWSEKTKQNIKSTISFSSSWRMRLRKQIWGCSQNQKGFPAAGLYIIINNLQR